MENTRLCIDCRYFLSDNIECDHKDNIELSLVTGVLFKKYSPMFLREDHISAQHLCGTKGKWFKPRVEMGIENKENAQTN